MAKPDPQAPATTTMGPAWTWQGGWLQQARHLPSPNFGERPAQALVDLVVVHSISLPPGEYGTGAVQQLFTNQLDWDAHPYYQGIRGLEVSAHFFVTRLGEVWQFVDCDARAWHAGASSWRKRDPGPGFDWPRLRGLLSRHQATANWQLPPRAGQPST